MELMKEDRENFLQVIKNTLDSHKFIQEAEIEIFDHHFKGFGIHPSTVRVNLFKKGDLTIVVLQDLAKGTSVTNAAEQIAKEVQKLKNINVDPMKTVWLECYPYYGGDYDIDQILFNFYNGSPVGVETWLPMRNEIVVNYLKKHIKL